MRRERKNRIYSKYIYDAFDTILQADVNTYNIVYDVQIQTLFYIQYMVKIRKDLLRLCHEKDMTTIIVSDSNMRENALGTDNIEVLLLTVFNQGAFIVIVTHLFILQ
jgi:hypothetical protein